MAVTASRSDAPAPIQLADAPSLVVEDPPARLDIATVIALADGAPSPRGLRVADSLAIRTVESPAASADAARLDAAQSGTAEAEPPAKDETVLFEADEVTRADDKSPIVASGKVRAFAGGRYLEADRITYDQATEIVVAEGSVSITEVADGVKQSAFADKVQLTGDLRDGIAEHFSALLDQGARLAGYDAVREQNSRTRVRKGVFSTCNVCTDGGEGRTPTWRIKALRMTRDEERKVVRFRHAFFELKGVPVIYMPYVQAADPSLERASGFLTPTFGSSSRLGFNLELPYYLAFSNHTDATFHPKFVSRDGVLWQGEVRQRGNHGGHVWQAGVIDFNPNKPDATGNLPVGVPGVRWHFFGAGSREVGSNWRLAYDVERVSDDTYFRQYNVIRSGDLRREIDTVSTLRLRSNINAVWKSGGSELRIDSFLFQGLRSTDNNRLTPYVLPVIDFRHAFDQPVAGGELTLGANFASLQRTSGADTRRLSVEASWSRDIVTPGGHKIDLLANLRADAFRYADLNEGTETVAPNPTTQTDRIYRFTPTLSAGWSYPLTRRFAGAQILVEPRAQIVVSPADKNPAGVLNEDSQSVEFDFAGLFEYNKAPGFDRLEDGQRVNVGLIASAAFDNGLTIEGSAGRQWRAQPTRAFNPGSGLGNKRSDIVGELNIRYKDNIALENRFRFDEATRDLTRAESQLLFNAWRFSGLVNYVRLNDENPVVELARREEVSGNIRFRLNRNWSVTTGTRRNLVTKQFINQDVTLGYSDECATFEVLYRRDLTRDVGLPADNAVLVRFTLRGLVD